MKRMKSLYFLSILLTIAFKDVSGKKKEFQDLSPSSFFLKTEGALTFLRNKRYVDDLNPTQSAKLRNECCSGRGCQWEERSETSGSWENVYSTLCEISIRENNPCTCVSRAGSNFECGSNLIGTQYCQPPCKEFNCNSGRICAKYSQQCDSNNDCGGWQDEIGCSKTRYTDDQIKSGLTLSSLNSNSKIYGVVTIFGRPICDDNWTNQNAKVVCRTLGFSSFGTLAIGWGNEKLSTNYFMNNVVCQGEENSLASCRHNTYHNCGPSEGAAAICLAPSSMRLQPFNSVNTKYEGSIFFEDVPICANQWDFKAAQVACNHLYQEEFTINVPVYSYRTSVAPSAAPYFLTSVTCTGNEKFLTQCQMSIAKSCATNISSVQCARCSPLTLMNIVKEIKFEGSMSEVYQSAEVALTKLAEKCRDWDCTISNPVYPEFCQVKAFLKSIKWYTKPRNEMFTTLSSEVDHFALLSHNYLRGNFETIRSDIDTLGEKVAANLGDYFSEIARFDQMTAKSEKENALKTLADLKARSYKTSNEMGEILGGLMISAFGISALDLESKAIVLALRIAGASNPIKWLTEGDSTLVDMKEAISEVAIQVLRIQQVEYIISNSIPKLSVLDNSISAKLYKNKDTFGNIKSFLEIIEKSKEFTKTQVENFIEHLEKYEPAITLIDISEYSTILSEIVEKLCEVIENPTTELGTIGATQALYAGHCSNAKPTASKLVALYTEISTQETAIMDSFSKFARANIAQIAANKLSISMKGTSGDQLRKLLTKYEALHVIRYHKVTLIKNACDYITYLNHGVEKQVCKDLLENPSGDPGALIATVPISMCECSTCHTKKGEFLIPATMTGENDTINLSTLYNSVSQVTDGSSMLKIPNKDWLLENRWISAFDEEPFFLKKINLYLPPANNITHEINIKLSLLDNQLGGKTYRFDHGITLKNIYTVNEQSCAHPNPYAIESCSNKLGTFCVHTEGIINDKLLPRLDGSTWNINIQSSYILPKIYSATKLFLKATAEFCFRSKSLNRPKHNAYSESQQCCFNNGMFTDQILRKQFPSESPCKDCPESSSPRLNGYFCEKCPAGYEPNMSYNFGCTPCPISKFKPAPGQFACDSCLDGKNSSMGAINCY